MKKIKKQIVLLLLCLVSQFGMWAQYNEIGEYTESGEDYLSDLYKREDSSKDCGNVESSCWWENINFTFGYTPEAIYANLMLINDAESYNIRDWNTRQMGVLETEIIAKIDPMDNNIVYLKDYSYYSATNSLVLADPSSFTKIQKNESFAQTRAVFFKQLEMAKVRTNIPLVNRRYITKINAKTKIRTTSLSRMKLLNFREEELNVGNTNNSEYGHLKYWLTPLSQITSIEQLDALRNQEKELFGDNEYRLMDDNNIKNVLDEIYDNIRDFRLLNFRHLLPYDKAKKYYHDIFDELYTKQNDYYESFDNRWDKLELIYQYTDNVKTYDYSGIKNSAPNGKPTYFGTLDFIEDYAIRNNGGAISIFHPGFSSYYLFIGFSVIKESQINMALKEISEEAMLLEICFENINIKNRNFIENNTALKEAVAAYFIENDYSKPAINFVGTMMKQYRTNLDFWPDPKYYVSYDGITSIPCPWDFSDRKESNIICDARARYPVFQNANRKDLALEIMF